MLDIIEFLKENWLPFFTTIGSVWLYFAERSKRKTEGRIGINDATEGMQNMYDKFVADAGEQYDKLNLKIKGIQENESNALKERDSLNRELNEIRFEIAFDKKRILELENKIVQYEEEIRKYKEQVKNLKTELSTYKRNTR